MRLDVCLLAEAAAGYDGKLFVHGGGVTRIVAPIIPWTHPQLALVVRLELEDGDTQQEHELAVQIEDPSGDPIVPRATFPIQVGEFLGVEGEGAYVNFALTISPLTFGRAGLHRFLIEVNGDPVRTLTLPVVIQPENER